MEKEPGKPLKIAITGPESSGKTSLASELATHFNTVWVPEYSREYLEDLGREYMEEDLVKIARRQRDSEKKYLGLANTLLFCDTDPIVMKIWALEKYNRVHPEIKEWLENEEYAYYLLCFPDLQWEYDPLRENPEKGNYFFHQFESEINKLDKPYYIVKGSGNERVNNAIKAITNWMKNEY